MSKKSRGFCITINNYIENDIKCMEAIECQYKCWEFEHILEGEGTPHIQGYLYYTNPRGLKGLSNLLPRANVLSANGTAQQCRKYCSKEDNGTFVEYGEMPEPQGKRNDLHEIKELVKSGQATELKIFEAARSYQAAMFGCKFLALQPTAVREKPWIAWYHGRTQTGKTRKAYEILGYDCFTKENSSWNMYSGHTNVLWDDFRIEDAPFNHLLRWFDRYPCQVNVKFGSQKLVFTKLIITCPQHPSDVYKNSKEDVQQLLRRIDEIVFFGGAIITPTSVPLN